MSQESHWNIDGVSQESDVKFGSVDQKWRSLRCVADVRLAPKCPHVSTKLGSSMQHTSANKHCEINSKEQHCQQLRHAPDSVHISPSYSPHLPLPTSSRRTGRSLEDHYNTVSKRKQFNQPRYSTTGNYLVPWWQGNDYATLKKSKKESLEEKWQY